MEDVGALAPLPVSHLRLTDPRRVHEAHALIIPMGRLRPGGAKSPGQCHLAKAGLGLELGLASVRTSADEGEAGRNAGGGRGGWRKASECPRSDQVHLSQTWPHLRQA